MIKYYIHDGATFLVPQYQNNRDFVRQLMEHAKAAGAAREEAGAAHAVYAVKVYGADGDLDHVDVYAPAVLMTEKEFEERTAAEYTKHPGCVIYASHAHE